MPGAKNRRPKHQAVKRPRNDDDSEDSDLSGLDDNYEPQPNRPSVEDLDDDEREIKRLEKLLGLNKRWKKKGKREGPSAKKLPSSFSDMGLDYLLKPLLQSEISKNSDRGIIKKKRHDRDNNDTSESDEEPLKSVERQKRSRKALYTEDAESAASEDEEVDGSSSVEDLDKDPDDAVVISKNASKKNPLNAETEQRLNRKAMAIMNRLSEPTVPPLFNEAKHLYTSGNFPRAAISNAFCDAAMATCVSKPTFVVPDKVSCPVAIFFALLRTTGCATDAVGQLIHRLSWVVVEYCNADDNRAADIRETPCLENAIRLISHLLLYRCLDTVLPLDILKKLGSHINQEDQEYFDLEKAEYAANLAIALLRAAGPALRKHDPSGLASTIREVQDAASAARSKTEISGGSRLSFLADVIAAVRNNNFAKIPGYDAEESARFSKLYVRLKQELSVHDSVNESPFRVSLNALAGFGASGSNWWLKADTCSGPMALEISGMAGGKKKNLTKDESQKQPKTVEEKKHSEMAKKLQLNTDVRKSIFSVIVSSNDIEEAVERLIKLPFRSELQRTEAVPVAFQCCVKEKNYNPFYSQLLSRLCAQEADKKQRLFRLAVKKSFTERLAMDPGSPLVVNNTAKLCIDLIRHNAISFITALRCIDFTSAAPGTPTYAFLHALLDKFFHPANLDESSFRRIIVEPLLTAKAQIANGRKLSQSLLLFGKHMYDSGKSVATADDESGKKVKGCGKYSINELKDRLDLLASELL